MDTTGLGWQSRYSTLSTNSDLSGWVYENCTLRLNILRFCRFVRWNWISSNMNDEHCRTSIWRVNINLEQKLKNWNNVAQLIQQNALKTRECNKNLSCFSNEWNKQGMQYKMFIRWTSGYILRILHFASHSLISKLWQWDRWFWKTSKK